MEEEKAGQPNAVVEGAPPQAETPQPEVPLEDSEVDDKGVPLKNRVAELARKLEDAQERLRRFEETQITAPRPVAENIPPMTARRKTREEVIEEINADPEGWIERKLQEKEAQRELVRQQERMKEAEKLIYDKDPSNFRENVSRVVGIINKYKISTANPVDGVQAALEILKNEQKLKDLVSKSTAQQVNVADKARIDNIKKTQTPTAATPKPQVTSDNSEALRKRAVETGSEKDVVNFFRNAIFNDDRK